MKQLSQRRVRLNGPDSSPLRTSPRCCDAEHGNSGRVLRSAHICPVRPPQVVLAPFHSMTWLVVPLRFRDWSLLPIFSRRYGTNVRFRTYDSARLGWTTGGSALPSAGTYGLRQPSNCNWDVVQPGCRPDTSVTARPSIQEGLPNSICILSAASTLRTPNSGLLPPEKSYLCLRSKRYPCFRLRTG